MMDPTLAAELAAHEVSDEEFVEAAFRHVLRRPPDAEARDRALSKLAAGTLSRATLIHELTSSEDFEARPRARRRRRAGTWGTGAP